MEYQLSLFSYFGATEDGFSVLAVPDLEMMGAINKFCQDNYDIIEQQIKLNLYKDII